MKKYSSKITNFFLPLLTSTAIILSACSTASNNSEIVFANYQSYMSPWLENNLSQRYGVKFNYFNVAEEVPANYRINVYDASVVSTSVLNKMIDTQAVKKINWANFHLLNNEGKLVTNATEALQLFTAPAQTILSQTYKNQKGEFVNLLNYGIPYFLQTFNFAYRGKIIPALNSENHHLISWNKMLEVIGQEPRFKYQTNAPKIAMVSDQRTLLSVSELLKTQTSVNPDPHRVSINDLYASYASFLNNGLTRENLGSHPILLNSDSNVVLNALANDPNSKSGVNGAFLYNGDAAFAAAGGDAEKNVLSDDFHFVENNATLYSLDMINFSANLKDEYLSNSSTLNPDSKLSRLYQFARSVALEGAESKDGILAESEKKSNLNSEEIASIQSEISGTCNTNNCYSFDANFSKANNDLVYKYGPTINFDYVQYTPPLKSLYRSILGVKNSGDSSGSDTKNTELIKKLESNNDLKFSDIEPLIENSYFYHKPADVYFGQLDHNPKLDYAGINLQNWKQYLSVANLPEASVANSNSDNLKVHAVVVDNNEVTVTYQLDDSKIQTVTSSLKHTANQNFENDNHEAIAKAKLIAKILMINQVKNLSNYVERQLSDIAKTNMLIAFNRLKNNW